ncbi:MAG: hypothetical protein JW810_00020 [Sedimentisphaerales bacterium]|nr:hypothetical protein [Sedimentisphaerales bacterium]
MRIVYVGSGEFGCATLRCLAASEHEVIQVITQPARPSGRGRRLQSTPIARLASQLHLACLEAEDINREDICRSIQQWSPELLLVIAFGQKLGPALLHLADCRVVNLHASLLPQYRGAAPIAWAIREGQTQTGLTLFSLNERWDAGAILGQITCPIDPRVTAGELHDRLAEMAGPFVLEMLDRIAHGRINPIAQDDRLASRAPKLTKQDGAIRWSQPADRLHDFLRAMWPWPGAYCRLQRRSRTAEPLRITLIRTQVEPDPGGPTGPADRPPAGTINEDLSIQCVPGRLRILELKPQNGRIMPFQDFVNGHRLQPGDRFLDG